jgi:hypothetical protein
LIEFGIQNFSRPGDEHATVLGRCFFEMVRCFERMAFYFVSPQNLETFQISSISISDEIMK